MYLYRAPENLIFRLSTVLRVLLTRGPLHRGQGVLGARIYGQFSKFHVCFCGLDPGNFKFETVRTNTQHIYFLGLDTLNLKFCDLKLWKLTVCVYIYIYMYTYLHLSLYTYLYISLYLSLSLYIYIYISISISLSLYIYIYIYMYMYIYIYIYKNK